MQELWVAVANRLAELFISLDANDYDALAACFMEDGAWTRQGRTLNGRSEIRAALMIRPATLRTIHIVSNVAITHSSDQIASVKFYLTVYRQDSSARPPYPVPMPAAVGLCKAQFGQDGNEWRLASLETGPYVFVG
jgi:hypothetical protein